VSGGGELAHEFRIMGFVCKRRKDEEEGQGRPPKLASDLSGG
jgi:hypothetical protein